VKPPHREPALRFSFLFAGRREDIYSVLRIHHEWNKGAVHRSAEILGLDPGFTVQYTPLKAINLIHQ
jgi:hypothetical protein